MQTWEQKLYRANYFGVTFDFDTNKCLDPPAPPNSLLHKKYLVLAF